METQPTTNRRIKSRRRPASSARASSHVRRQLIFFEQKLWWSARAHCHAHHSSSRPRQAPYKMDCLHMHEIVIDAYIVFSWSMSVTFFRNNSSPPTTRAIKQESDFNGTQIYKVRCLLESFTARVVSSVLVCKHQAYVNNSRTIVVTFQRILHFGLWWLLRWNK
jgi:hypothetical protein